MNKLNYNVTGGFPLKTERLQDIEEAYTIFNALGYLGGDMTIISGCTVSGSNTTDGFVFYNGEVFDFKGGLTATNVKVIEELTYKFFEDGTSKVLYKKRYITFGSGSGSIAWANFNRLDPLKEIQRRILPPGTNPQLYCGSVGAIPSGWQLCDGTNGTPDLRSRFIVGYNPDDSDYDAIGKVGGAKTVALTAAQNGQHSHTASTGSAGAHTHNVALNVNAEGGGIPSMESGSSVTNQNFATNSAGAHTHTVTVDNSGSGDPHENRPPYYTLAYIIYTGA